MSDREPTLADVLQAVDSLRQQLRDVAAGVATLLAERHEPDPLLSRKAICSYLGRSKAWFYAQRFWPEPDETLPGRNGKRWRRSTVDRVLQEQERHDQENENDGAI